MLINSPSQKKGRIEVTHFTEKSWNHSYAWSYKQKNGALREIIEFKIPDFNILRVNMNQEQNRGIIKYIKESMAHATLQRRNVSWSLYH